MLDYQVGYSLDMYACTRCICMCKVIHAYTCHAHD